MSRRCLHVMLPLKYQCQLNIGFILKAFAMNQHYYRNIGFTSQIFVTKFHQYKKNNWFNCKYLQLNSTIEKIVGFTLKLSVIKYHCYNNIGFILEILAVKCQCGKILLSYWKYQQQIFLADVALIWAKYVLIILVQYR